jgi:hypothetical protein
MQYALGARLPRVASDATYLESLHVAVTQFNIQHSPFDIQHSAAPMADGDCA